jgi:protein CMS1
LRKFQTKDAVIAKLFAKHIKLNEAEEFVKKSRMGIAVGTPARITDLLNSGDYPCGNCTKSLMLITGTTGALSLDRLVQIVVDASHVDQKKQSILDMRDTLLALMTLLNRPGLKERYTEPKKQVRLIFY